MLTAHTLNGAVGQSGQRDLLSFCMMPLKSEDRSENKKENHTKWVPLSIARGFIFCWQVFVCLFFMLPSQDETQTSESDNCCSDFTTSTSMRNKLQASTHAGAWSGFLQRAAAMPGTCNTSLQKYFSETSLVLKSLPLQHQVEVIYEPLEGKSRLLPASPGCCQHPLPHGSWCSSPCLLLSSMCFERLTPFRINQPCMLQIVSLAPGRASWSC